MLSDAQCEVLNALTEQYERQSTAGEGENQILAAKDSDAVLRAFYFALHDQAKLLEHAMDTIDVDSGRTKAVREIKESGSGRKCWKVRGSQGNEYLCLDQYCSCPSFMQLCRGHEMRVVCKHMVAVRLAKALHLVEYKEVNREEFVRTILQPDAAFDTTQYGHDRR